MIANIISSRGHHEDKLILFKVQIPSFVQSSLWAKCHPRLDNFTEGELFPLISMWSSRRLGDLLHSDAHQQQTGGWLFNNSSANPFKHLHLSESCDVLAHINSPNEPSSPLNRPVSKLTREHRRSSHNALLFAVSSPFKCDETAIASQVYRGRVSF